MAVNYADFRDIAIEDYDAVVVGSGFAGAVSARQLAEEGGLRVLVIEKRAHIAGNMYDEYDEAGVLVHRYGPVSYTHLDVYKRQELESIVSVLESNTLELEESLAAYERGVVLLGSLQKRLGLSLIHI